MVSNVGRRAEPIVAPKRRSVIVLLRALVVLCLLFIQPLSASTIRVGVMTMQPGEIFWERFGHNAIVIDDGTKTTSYNFGFFDLSEPGFVKNFLRGRMYYILAALPIEQDLAYYQQAGRGVSIQWLNLTPEQSKRLQERLNYIAKPENARYRYEYFTNNCASKVRDILDETLNGQLQKQMTSSSLGNTYRSESVRLAWPATWMFLGFDLAMSSHGDKPLNRWQDAFIPMRLAQSLSETKLPNGKALVSDVQNVLPHKLPTPPDEMPDWSLQATFIGIALALLFSLAGQKPRLFNALTLGFWFISGLIGSALLAIWLATEHYFVHGNENILLFSPLAWLCIILFLLRNRSPKWLSAFHLTVKLVAALAALAVIIKLLPLPQQSNINWLLMFLPVHWAITRQINKANVNK